jgi:hypothetical protein
MTDRRWTMQRGSVSVWQRLPHGPAPARRSRLQARRGRRSPLRSVAGGLAAIGALVALAAGWGSV